MRKTCKIFTFVCIDCPNAQLLVSHKYSVRLRDSGALRQSLGNPTMELAALLGVREVLKIGDL